MKGTVFFLVVFPLVVMVGSLQLRAVAFPRSPVGAALLTQPRRGVETSAARIGATLGLRRNRNQVLKGRSCHPNSVLRAERSGGFIRPDSGRLLWSPISASAFWLPREPSLQIEKGRFRKGQSSSQPAFDLPDSGDRDGDSHRSNGCGRNLRRLGRGQSPFQGGQTRRSGPNSEGDSHLSFSGDLSFSGADGAKVHFIGETAAFVKEGDAPLMGAWPEF